MRWVDGSGKSLHDWHPEGDYMRRMSLGRQDHSAAQVNHYMVRSAESFGLKKGTLSPVAGKDRYTDSFFDRYNRNEVEDRSALTYSERFDPIHAEAMALSDIAALHHLCCADYVARLAAKAGMTPEDDPRYRHHRDEAERQG